MRERTVKRKKMRQHRIKRTRKLFVGGHPALTKLTMIGPILRSALYRTPKKVELLAILKSVFTNAMEDLGADKLITELTPLEKELFTAYRFYKGMIVEHPFLQARDKLQTSQASANFMQLTKHIFNDKSKQKVFADNLSLFFTNEEKLNAKDYKLFTEKVSQEYAGNVVPYAEFQWQGKEKFSKKPNFADQLRAPDPTLQIGKENMRKREEDLNSRDEALKQAELKEVASELIQLIKVVENTTPQTILKAHIKAIEDKAKMNEMFKEIAADVTTDDFQSKQRTYEENIGAYELSVYLEKQMKELKRMQQEKNHSVKNKTPEKAKVSPAKEKVSPVKEKVSPVKEKVSPAKVSPAKVSPAKVPPAKVPPAKSLQTVKNKKQVVPGFGFGLTQRGRPPIIEFRNFNNFTTQPSFAASIRPKTVSPKQQASPIKTSPVRSPDPISSPTQQKRSRRNAFDLEALKPTQESFGFDLFQNDDKPLATRRRRNALASFEEEDE